ncbi:metalloregulator ArsR/SmtB family transcription factor [Paenibacillus sp. sgz500958]|uniref:ArsR/SmtB family transcription factor n=1 Tax=Paenibacillus sp. sgz500958 TaxID=3242475 RepID=UPI0036D26B55
MSSLPTLHRKIKAIISPFHELLCSLHVLNQPEHHPKRLQWALDLNKKMPTPLKEVLSTLAQLTDEWLGLADLPAHAGVSMSCAEGIQELRSLPEAELVHLMLNGKTPLSTILLWMNRSTSNASEAELRNENGQYLVKHVKEVRKLLVDSLETYERDFFRQEWDYIEPWVNTAAAQFQETAYRNPEKALNTLHPRLFAENGTLSAQKAITYYYPYDQLQHVYVLPSTFIFPHLLIGGSNDFVCLPLTVDIPGLPVHEGPPADLLRQFKALGDDTRLRILKLLWSGPHCTKQLAPLLGISEAAVSKQLKLLSEAGLTKSERKGNYLFYTGNKEAMEQLIVIQRQFLEQ